MKLGHVHFSSYDSLLPVKLEDIEECVVHIGTWMPSSRSLWVARSLLVPNRAEDPTKFFSVWSRDVPVNLRPYVVGVSHTHVGRNNNGVSAYDVARIKKTSYFGIVYHHGRGTVKLYDSSGWIATEEWRK